MGSASKRKGTAWETAIRDTLRASGVDVERLVLAGTKDEGDLVAKWEDRRGRDRVAVIEAKNRQKIDLAAYVREAETERDAYCAARNIPPSTVEAVAFVKRRNHGVMKAYAVMELGEYLSLADNS